MYSKPRLALKYLSYFFSASNGHGHGIHSPFVFDFVRQVLLDKKPEMVFEEIEGLRSRLLQDHRLMEIQDLGAGSASDRSDQRILSAIVRGTGKSPKLGRLLFRIAQYYKPSVIIELGTSAGISTAYLASGNAQSTYISIEGAKTMADLAQQNFIRLGIKNIQTITGNFDEELPRLLQTLQVQGRLPALTFIDGNHRKEPTLRYFDLLLKNRANEAVIIMDDIHWSPEMETAWKIIRADPRVLLTIDLFFLGLVFFREEFKTKQDFRIRY